MLLVALLLGGCLGSDEIGSSDETGTNDIGPAIAKAHGVQLQLMPGWQAAEQSLTPKLLNPMELLSVGTLRMKPGGCATVPLRTLKSMGTGDAVITIQERLEGRPEDYPPRPESFRVHPAVEHFECAPQDLKVQAFVFSEAGRQFTVLAAVERGAPLDEVEAILNSFEASPEPS
jgi:hypothetical protein